MLAAIMTGVTEENGDALMVVGIQAVNSLMGQNLMIALQPLIYTYSLYNINMGKRTPIMKYASNSPGLQWPTVRS